MFNLIINPINAVKNRLKNIMIWHSWAVADSGYEVQERLLVAKSPPRSRGVICLKNDVAEQICMDFVALDPVPETICEFANEYGFLTEHTGRSESLALWELEIGSATSMLSARYENRPREANQIYSTAYNRQKGASAGFSTSLGRSDLEFRCTALDLASWLWLEIGHNLMDREVARCRQCTKFFLRGGGKGTRRMQSRRTKQFCAIQCKTIYNNRIAMSRRPSS